MQRALATRRPRGNTAAPAAGFATRAPSTTAPAPAPGIVDTMVARLAPTMDLRVGDKAGGLRLSGTVGVVVMMGLMTLLPTLVLMMTGFTRILVVLHFLKQAMGTQSAPPNHLVGALALLLTGFVMAPTMSDVHRVALQPWMEGRIEQVEMLERGARPMREFMLRQTRERDLQTFVEMSRPAVPPKTVDEVPLVVVMSAFVTSELRTAFQLGFALFLPFIVIDVVVSSVLMSMGMFMLPPAMIALPFKLLLFVLVDGWQLVIQSLVQSFR
ncbi:flagellar type III secretion system pore protein FliP [Roseisolibacter sp. H3M3-2]|nr:flagellar type III secretion system pore protein FliP [Roseisolibacter sp. H3M3-2]MDF1504251.1 flagellar type III secretion system pore protein FliP [Roseisolibacter sp. H3M3-2]